MFDFGSHLRLSPILGALHFAQRPMPMGFGLDEPLGLGGMVRNGLTLSAVGGIAPHSRLLPVQQFR